MAKLTSEVGGSLDQGFVVYGLPWRVDPPPALGIVLTNTCDFEHDNAQFVIAAALVPARPVIQGSAEFENKVANADKGELSKTRWKSVRRLLEDKIFNREIARYFLLDADELGMDPLFADFQFLVSVPISWADEMRAVAKLQSPYREQLIVHFASYTSRIGVERPHGDDLSRLHETLADPWIPPN